MDNILYQIRDSGLYEEIAGIRCGVLGQSSCLSDPVFADPKIEIRFFSEDIYLCESATLNLLWEDSQNEEFLVLYLHGKGVSKPGNACVADWVNYMLHFNVRLHRIAAANLKYSDCCGVNYQDNHYSGDFWWSKSSYIRRLNKPGSAREHGMIAAETWLTSLGLRNNPNIGHCKWVNLWTSGVRHYVERYPEETYIHCRENYDSRLKRLLTPADHIVVANYKCGFSSSNLLEWQPLLQISPQDKIVFLYRNIFLRTVSTFINWCVTDERYRDERDWLIANIKNNVDPEFYRRFIGLLHERRFVEAFADYMAVLPRIYGINDHSRPQSDILGDYSIERVDYFVELEDTGRFQEITGTSYPFDQTNRSARGVKTPLLQCLRNDQSMRENIRDIYKRDITFFKRHGIRIDDARVLAQSAL